MKRAASGPHGDKDTGHIAADDEIEEAFTPRQATAAQMAKRKILKPRSGRHGASHGASHSRPALFGGNPSIQQGPAPPGSAFDFSSPVKFGQFNTQTSGVESAQATTGNPFAISATTPSFDFLSPSQTSQSASSNPFGNNTTPRFANTSSSLSQSNPFNTAGSQVSTYSFVGNTKASDSTSTAPSSVFQPLSGTSTVTPALSNYFGDTSKVPNSAGTSSTLFSNSVSATTSRSLSSELSTNLIASNAGGTSSVSHPAISSTTPSETPSQSLLTTLTPHITETTFSSEPALPSTIISQPINQNLLASTHAPKKAETSSLPFSTPSSGTTSQSASSGLSATVKDPNATRGSSSSYKGIFGSNSSQSTNSTFFTNPGTSSVAEIASSARPSFLLNSIWQPAGSSNFDNTKVPSLTGASPSSDSTPFSTSYQASSSFSSNTTSPEVTEIASTAPNYFANLKTPGLTESNTSAPYQPFSKNSSSGLARSDLSTNSKFSSVTETSSLSSQPIGLVSNTSEGASSSHLPITKPSSFTEPSSSPSRPALSKSASFLSSIQTGPGSLSDSSDVGSSATGFLVNQPSSSFSNPFIATNSQSSTFNNPNPHINYSSTESQPIITQTNIFPSVTGCQDSMMFSAADNRPRSSELSPSSSVVSDLVDQITAITPPTIPAHFSAQQRQQFITGYHLRILEKSFKQNFANVSPLQLDFEPMKVYGASREAILQTSGLQRKAVDGDLIGGPRKHVRVQRDIPPTGAATSSATANVPATATEREANQKHNIQPTDKAASSSAVTMPTTGNKRKADEELSKNSDDQDSAVGVKRARGNVEAPIINGTPSAPAFKVPSFGAVSGTNFQAQFSKMASVTAEKAAQEAEAKRKAEESSDEEEEGLAPQKQTVVATSVLAGAMKSGSEIRHDNIFGHLASSSRANENEGSAVAAAKDGESEESDADDGAPPAPINPFKAASTTNPFAYASPTASPWASAAPLPNASALPSIPVPTARPAERSLFDRIEQNADGTPKREVSPISVPNPPPAGQSLFDRIEKKADEPLKPEVTSPTSVAAKAKNPFAGSLMSSQSPSPTFGATFASFATSSSPLGFPSTTTSFGALAATKTSAGFNFGGPHQSGPVTFPSGRPFGSADPSRATSPNTVTGKGAAEGSGNETDEDQDENDDEDDDDEDDDQYDEDDEDHDDDEAAAVAKATAKAVAKIRAKAAAKAEEEDRLKHLNGEENEVVLFQTRARVSELIKEEGIAKWVERGTGPLKLLRDDDTEFCRVVVRRDPGGKVAMNHAVNPDISYALDGDSETKIGFFSPTDETGKTFTKWVIQVRKEADAARLLRYLKRENRFMADHH